RPLRVGRGRREELAQRVNGHLAGDLAGRVAAHPVRHDVKAALLDDREIVFVVRALHADVRFAGHFDAERSSHGKPFWVWRRSRPESARGDRGKEARAGSTGRWGLAPEA